MATSASAIAILIFEYPVLYIMSWLGGFICEIINSGYKFNKKFIIKPLLKTIKIHPFIGILAMGILARNLPWKLCDNLNNQVNTIIVDACFGIFLYRGGFVIDISVLKKKLWSILALGIIPVTIEGSISFIIGFYLLNLSTFISLTMAMMVIPSAVGIIIPIVLDVQKQGYGIDQDVATITISSSSFENILASTLFWIFFGFISKSKVIIFNGSEEPLLYLAQTGIEIALGLITGFILLYCLTKWGQKLSGLSIFLITVIIEIGTIVIFKQLLQFRIIGYFLLFSLNSGLKKTMHPKVINSCNQYSLKVFNFSKYLLFGTVGATIVLADIKDGSAGQILLLAIVAIIIKVIATSLTINGDFNIKERLYLGILMSTKAAPQAAFATQILFAERKKTNPDADKIEQGIIVLTVGIFLIFLGLPLGGCGGATLGTKWLRLSKSYNQSNKTSEERLTQLSASTMIPSMKNIGEKNQYTELVVKKEEILNEQNKDIEVNAEVEKEEAAKVSLQEGEMNNDDDLHNKPNVIDHINNNEIVISQKEVSCIA